MKMLQVNERHSTCTNATDDESILPTEDKQIDFNLVEGLKCCVLDLSPSYNHHTMTPKRSCLKRTELPDISRSSSMRKSGSMPNFMCFSSISPQQIDGDSSPSSEEIDGSSSPSSEHSTTRKEPVHFGTVEVREHGLILGDHPDCSYGPPLQLDWDCQEVSTQLLDEYELTRKPRRRKGNLAINYYQRRNILMHDVGMSEKEIKAATRKVHKDHIRRSITKALLPLSVVETVVESSTRKMKRAKENYKKENGKESGGELQAYGMKFKRATSSVPLSVSRTW